TIEKNEKIESVLSSEKEEVVSTFNMPRHVVAKAYQNNSTSASSTTVQKTSFKDEMDQVVHPEKKLTMEEQIQKLYQSGKTIDEIARMLQKGKTEIELLLKFQH
ncbi:MAG TPA: helix-turn-helix domain-containing protein, partial [Rummeliibacillus sp.]|nr:helix-turn-helix domain-containing protein [Rummeliibacillus sp.]